MSGENHLFYFTHVRPEITYIAMLHYDYQKLVVRRVQIIELSLNTKLASHDPSLVSPLPIVIL
jgi:hypothetical protein